MRNEGTGGYYNYFRAQFVSLFFLRCHDMTGHLYYRRWAQINTNLQRSDFVRNSYAVPVNSHSERYTWLIIANA